LSASDIRPEDYKRRPKRKKIVRTTTSRSLADYDAWRNHDRRVFIHDAKHRAAAKLMLVPSELWRVFG